MREGLAALWVLSLGFSVLMWAYQTFLFSRYGNYKNRRNLTGFELARQFLDRHHFNRVSIHSEARGGRAHFGLQWDRLDLSERVSSGNGVADLAVSLHETTHLLEGSKQVLPAGIRARGGTFFRLLVLVSWLLTPFGGIGQLLFVFAFFFACASLTEEWEVTERAAANLKLIEGLTPDEFMRIKKLLKALTWLPFAELVAGPFWLCASLRGRMPSGDSHRKVTVT